MGNRLFLGGAFHPGAKVMAVLVIAIAVLLSRTPVGLLATMGVVALALLATPGAATAFARLVARLRWVFLFIILLHGWFTPGQPLVRGGGPWWPSQAGLAHGLELVVVVVLMSAMVAVLVRSTAVTDLAAGVAWVLAPLGRLGLPVGRFGQLLAWTVDRVEPVRQEASRVRDALRLRSGSDAGMLGRLRLEAGTARAVLRRAREASDRNAEALYLRQAGEVRRLGAPLRRDLLLLGGTAVWSGLLVGLGSVGGG